MVTGCFFPLDLNALKSVLNISMHTNMPYLLHYIKMQITDINFTNAFYITTTHVFFIFKCNNTLVPTTATIC